jgi:hypothetical protein
MADMQGGIVEIGDHQGAAHALPFPFFGGHGSDDGIGLFKASGQGVSDFLRVAAQSWEGGGLEMLTNDFDRGTAGHFSGIVASHAVCHYVKPLRRQDGKGVFVFAPQQAGVGFTGAYQFQVLAMKKIS